MEAFKRTTNGFNYVFEREVYPGETIILKMPVISPNKRGINDIGWYCDDDIKLYVTLSSHPDKQSALWQEIPDGGDINKTVSYIKIVGGASKANIVIRAILN